MNNTARVAPTQEEAKTWLEKQAEMHPGVAPDPRATPKGAQVIPVEGLGQAAAKALGAPQQATLGGYRVLITAPVLHQIKKHVLSRMAALARSEGDLEMTFMELLEMEDLLLECLTFFCQVDSEGNDIQPSEEYPGTPADLRHWFQHLGPEDAAELLDAYAGSANWPFVLGKVKSMLGKFRGVRA